MSARVSSTEERSSWDRAVGEVLHATRFAHYGLVQAASRALSDARPRLYVVERPNGALLVPLLVRPIGSEGWDDAESPGYAGVLFRGKADPSDWKELEGALASDRVVSAFIRIPPFAELEPYKPVLLPFSHLTAYVPLERGADAAFEGGAFANHRAKARRAERSGYQLAVHVAPSHEALNRFREIYLATMDRLQAVDEYRYPQEYFHSLRDGARENLVLFECSDSSHRLVYAALMLLDGSVLHYLLGGRTDDVANIVGNYVFDQAARWAAQAGATALHLGGGTSGQRDDALFQFKARIGSGEAALHLAGIRSRPADADELLRRWEAQTGAKPRWFLGWRQPVPPSRGAND